MLELQKKGYYLNNCLELPKKPVLVLITYGPMIETSKENDVVLNWILYIYYLIWFKKKQSLGLN